jgi:hypothetical protein
LTIFWRVVIEEFCLTIFWRVVIEEFCLTIFWRVVIEWRYLKYTCTFSGVGHCGSNSSLYNFLFNNHPKPGIVSILYNNVSSLQEWL